MVSPGLTAEVVHLIVEQESEPVRGNARAEAAVQGVRDGDRVAFAIDDGKVRGFGAFIGRKIAGTDFRAGRSFVGIDALAQLRNVSGIQECGDRDLLEVGIAEMFRAIGEIAAHGLRLIVQRISGARPDFA